MDRVPVRHRSRSPDAAGAPLLRRRLCLEPHLHAPSTADSSGNANSYSGNGNGDDGVGGERGRGGLSATEWRQLYERVLPNPFEMGDFQRVVLDGELHDHFLAKDLHKLVMELRVLLESHGELRMAEQLMLKGRKKELAHAVATALQLLEKGRPRRLPSESHAANATAPTPSSSLSTVNPQCAVAPPAPPPTASSLSASSPPPVPAVSRVPFAKICLDPPTCRRPRPPNLAAAELPVESPEAPEAHEALDALNKTNSPFLRVLHIAKRAQLRFGSFPLRFDVPACYAEAVAARRLRLLIIPLRHPATPARWPAAKDIVVYVNGQCIMTPWKRAWPERRVEVAKSFLPLDITQYLNRKGTAQQLHINVFAREYFSQLALVVAQPRTPEEVVADMAPPLTVESDVRDAAAYDFYRIVVEDEDPLSGEVEMADPVIATKCPILQTRIVIPVRGTRCRHLQCFDCQAFLLSCHKGCYWNCPLCDAELRPPDLVVDSVLWRYMLSLGDACAPHLCLRRDSGESGSGVPPFGWAPHAMHGDSCDVVVDEEDEERKESPAAEEREKEMEERRERVQGSGGKEEWNGPGEERTSEDGEREEAERQLGTAACPIEL